ncbi:MAG: glycoside hydrolase family 16 protein [Chthoniobacterales bacterium]
MRIEVFFRGVAAAFFLGTSAYAKTLHFSGYDWEVRGNETGGPGPNHWSDSNAWLDAAGRLHLRLSQHDGQWFCPEVSTTKRFGPGSYRFAVTGPIDRLDKNVVLGLFDYPEPKQGPDGTHEIDIEFAHWGNASYPIGNFTVWPAVRGVDSTSKTFEFRLPGATSTHIFTRTAAAVSFESRAAKKLLGKWTFAPADAARRISREAMPVHINLWLFDGHPPADGREVEIVIRSFKFTPR